MKLDYSKKILAVSVTTFLVVFVLAIVFSSLLSGKIKSINDKTKQLASSAQEREEDLALSDSITDSKEDRTKLERHFVGPSDVETASFISEIESLASLVGLDAVDVKSVSAEPVSDFTSTEISLIRLRVGVVGSWSKVFNFLKIVENLPKVSTVNSSSFQMSSDAEGVKSWSLEVDFSVAKLSN